MYNLTFGVCSVLHLFLSGINSYKKVSPVMEATLLSAAEFCPCMRNYYFLFFVFASTFYIRSFFAAPLWTADKALPALLTCLSLPHLLTEQNKFFILELKL